jgi:C2 domain
LEVRNALKARHKFGRKGSRTQVRLAIGKKHARIEFVHDGQNPVFQEHFAFDQLSESWTLEVELRDRMTSGPSSSRFKGSFTILPDQVQPGTLITRWYTLRPRSTKDKHVQGEILLQLVFFPDGIESVGWWR